MFFGKHGHDMSSCGVG